MYQPNDVNKVSDEDWEEFKKKAAQDELYYTGPGDLLDTPEGRRAFRSGDVRVDRAFADDREEP